ncbi:cytochrome c maturation protein CcmE [Paucibacter sp. B2R-40]|uniref:cytochrome c maturation protein CcmE n=1 Tax=Paucibacter sp. B2R-40 TaxID=2893554 RepID=UPI0021E4A1F0|nr:cytochrome c maturation protein CcmE [Paucibacter sp. B2R-40]MCV2355683.1 cytochrome c maturation protein CcmE [Paucibacter sp. B2R-40]
MSPRQKRLLLLGLGLAGLGLATALVLQAFSKNLVFFYTPSQVQAGEAPKGRSFRVGGLVEAGSLQREADGLGNRFVVTDQQQRLQIHYRGLLPDLFKEGKGVVAQGRLSESLGFVAEEVLAKHDENYMPPEAARALEAAAKAKQQQGLQP